MNTASKQITDQLGLRKADKIASKQNDLSDHFRIFLSSCDEGVWRNGGRKGASFAAKSIVNHFARLSKTNDDFTYSVHEVADSDLAKEDFNQAQHNQSEQIATHLLDAKGNLSIAHIGGGHDHIYCLLTALSKKYNKIKVVNLDAHYDTRTDEIFHSGTPFRQFDQVFDGKFELIQLGIHHTANSSSTISPLSKGKMQAYDLAHLQQETQAYSTLDTPVLHDIFEHEDDEVIVFSLDCDAIDIHSMPGVSAPNAHGLSKRFVNDLLKLYCKSINHPQYIGIYEYNPIYDHLGASGARFIAHLLYQTLN